MNEAELIILLKNIVCWIMIPYFIFIVLFSGGKIFSSAFVCVFSIIAFFSISKNNSFIDSTNTALFIDSIAALAMSLFLNKDKLVKVQSLLFVFASICHLMILLSLLKEPVTFTLFFFDYYDQFIILISLTQMAVSWNGFNRAFVNFSRRKQGNNSASSAYSNCVYTNLFKIQSGKGRT